MIPRVNYANLAKADYTVSCQYNSTLLYVTLPVSIVIV